MYLYSIHWSIRFLPLFYSKTLAYVGTIESSVKSISYISLYSIILMFHFKNYKKKYYYKLQTSSFGWCLWVNDSKRNSYIIIKILNQRDDTNKYNTWHILHNL